MATTDTTVSNLIINKLTKDQYDAILNPSDTEIYLVPDEIDTTPTSGSDNPVTSGGVYTALSNKADSSDIPTESTVSGWGFTKNAGTITGITMNGASKGTSGVVDLGTVITDVSGLMPITGSIAANTNLSNLSTGMYAIDNITNSDFPVGPFFGTLIQGTGSYKPQILIGGGAGASSVYTRRWLTGSSSWTAWTDASVPSNLVTGSGQSYTIAVVSSMPSSPDSNTIYLVTGS